MSGLIGRSKKSPQGSYKDSGRLGLRSSELGIEGFTRVGLDYAIATGVTSILIEVIRSGHHCGSHPKALVLILGCKRAGGLGFRLYIGFRVRGFGFTKV